MGQYLISRYVDILTKNDILVSRVDREEIVDLQSKLTRTYKSNNNNPQLSSLYDQHTTVCDVTPRIPVKAWNCKISNQLEIAHVNDINSTSKSNLLMEVLSITLDGNFDVYPISDTVGNIGIDEAIVVSNQPDVTYTVITERMLQSRYTTVLVDNRTGQASSPCLYIDGLRKQLKNYDKAFLTLLFDIPDDVWENLKTYYDILSLSEYKRYGLDVDNFIIHRSYNTSDKPKPYYKSTIRFLTDEVDEPKMALYHKLIKATSLYNPNHTIAVDVSFNHHNINNKFFRFSYEVAITVKTSISCYRPTRLDHIDYTPFINILKLNNISIFKIELEHNL